LGINWVLDTAAVAQWREDQTIKNTVGELTSLGEVELKRRKLQAETKVVLLDEVDQSLTVLSEHDG
jgi:hypothetical protein